MCVLCVLCVCVCVCVSSYLHVLKKALLQIASVHRHDSLPLIRGRVNELFEDEIVTLDLLIDL